MTADVDAGGSDALAPDEAFALLGNETRVGILQALWEAHRPYEEGTALSFSALYDRVRVTDTGNFNYHLGKLTGHFVRRTDEGYELTAPGFEVVRAVVAGAATANPILDPARVDATCDRCGSPVEVVYEDGTTWAQRTGTGCAGYWADRPGTILGFSLPPEGLRNRTPDGILRATLVYSMHRFATMCEGVCPACGGSVAGSLAACPSHDASDGFCDACGGHFLGVVTLACDSCKFAWRSPSWAPVHHHPALVAFYHEHGVDHVASSWEGMARGFEWREELLSVEPTRLLVTVPCDGDELRLVLDGTGSVVDVDDDVDRSSAPAAP